MIPPAFSILERGELKDFLLLSLMIRRSDAGLRMRQRLVKYLSKSNDLISDCP